MMPRLHITVAIRVIIASICLYKAIVRDCLLQAGWMSLHNLKTHELLGHTTITSVLVR